MGSRAPGHIFKELEKPPFVTNILEKTFFKSLALSFFMDHSLMSYVGTRI